eukprot:m.890043 g.890043  ORF g.890043 m.890043 type:complete len:424 (-) comp23648_c0_seq7:3481-4752(-)
MSSRFADSFNAKVKRQRTEKSSGNGSVQDRMTSDDHASLMRRESYQDIFKTLAQSQPNVHGPDALAAAAVVAAMADNISGASSTMPTMRSPLGVGSGRGAAQPPMYTTTNATQSGHPPTMMTGLSAMNHMVQAAAMVQAGASGASAAVSYSTNRASGGAGGKKRLPGPVMQPTSMPPQLQMQMQAVIQQQAQQAQQQHRYISSTSMAPLQGAAPGMPSSGPAGPTPDTSKKVNRLWKNRLAAKECRRKKKEYVKDLEDKVRDLEQKNEELMKQLRAARSSLTPAEREVLKKGVPAAPKPAQTTSSAPDKSGFVAPLHSSNGVEGNGGMTRAGPDSSDAPGEQGNDSFGNPAVSNSLGASSTRAESETKNTGEGTSGSTTSMTVVEAAVPASAAGLPLVTSVPDMKPVAASQSPQSNSVEPVAQ